MTSYNENIFIFGFGQLFNGRATQIDQCKRAQNSSYFRAIRSHPHDETAYVNICVTFLEYNFVIRTISLH
jgi:hypothetical protein